MEKESRAFLESLLTTPSPTGFEERIQAVVRKRMTRYADSIESDLHGNLMVAINPDAKRRIMLAGHCDQIGFMISHITNDGFIYVAPLGGIDVGVLQGAKVTINGAKGPVQGVFGRKPIHQQSPEERSSMKLDINKVWIDIGARNKKEAEKLVQVGDSATFTLGVMQLGSDFICAPGLDDRVGLFIVMEALRLCKGAKLNVGLFAVSTVQEEVGLRGATTAAFSIDPEVGIAVDVTHASDSPANENSKSAPCKLGSGPAICRGPNVNPVVERMLVDTAKKNKIPWQPSPSSRLLGNDANAIQVVRGGVAAGSIGVPNRYMHTQVEVCSLKDLENCAKLLAQFVKSVNVKTDFRPS